ncbi:MAG: Rrf2 family transcriptional regulator [Syntrophales bacterium]|nr:Rrf2 family transcriptional regulator [Syntrophales bacterium]
MKLSTRARYGLRLMFALAKNYGKGYVLLKDVACAEEISEKYLSLIVIPLRSTGLINSARGATGGYSLARDPSQITVKEIVDVLEGEALLDCLKNPSLCPRVSSCVSRDVWVLLNDKISETLSSITLEKLIQMENEKISGGKIEKGGNHEDSR